MDTGIQSRDVKPRASAIVNQAPNGKLPSMAWIPASCRNDGTFVDWDLCITASVAPREQEQNLFIIILFCYPTMPITDKTFIETQFPVSLISKESYKERKARL